jgi:hypothetical protein
MFAVANISLSPYWNAGHWLSKKKLGTTVPFASERVMTQSLNRQKKRRIKREMYA